MRFDTIEERYRNAVKDIESRTNEKKEPTLEKTREALEELGDPQEGYEITLVGGTNGKGSTVEMASEMLASKGFKVGTFTSPHLVTVRERIRVDSEKISRAEFLELYDRIDSLDIDLSFFEFTTVMAYLYFGEKGVDHAVVEVGMGGRLDATNAVENSGAAVTNVGKDHSQYLGDTREEIAEEKAGIVPEEGFVVDGTSLDVIESTARERGAEIHEPFDVASKDGRYLWKGEEIRIPVRGRFQAENLGAALRIVQSLEEVPEDVEQALSDLECRGRMEIVGESPVYIHDGAHNHEAMKKAVEDYPDGASVVFGCMKDKPAGDMLEKLEKTAEKFFLTAPEFERSADPEVLARKVDGNSESFGKVEDALNAALSSDNPIVVTGSLYLVGAVKDLEAN